LAGRTAEDPLRAAVVARHVDRLWIAREQLHAVGLDQQVDDESASGLPLAVQAVTAMCEKRIGRKPVPNCSAGAATLTWDAHGLLLEERGLDSTLNRSVPTFRFNVVDVFTDTPLQGNQLAVFTDAREIPEDKLQDLAREVGFSETVFVYPPAADGAHARIRIFTPGVEVPFAGHPTLGSAFVLAGPLQLGEIRLETGNGVVPVRLEREGARIIFGRMTQPIPTIAPYEDEAGLLEAIGVERSELPIEVYDNGLQHVFVVLGSKDEVAALRPDLTRLADVPEVIGINCLAGSGTSWKTRMFIPSGGIAEDPATGSAAGPLALHLARHGRIAFGDEIEITQGVEIQRPSKLYARVDGSAERIERIEVGGSAVVVARGEFSL
jgi:trans-2,3-dihydro-3-hydroxyanthranilate isomerase